MTRYWTCIFKCNYCDKKKKAGTLPKGWRQAKERSYSAISLAVEYHCCDNLKCIENFELHIETEMET